jgi:hypothetical protein
MWQTLVLTDQATGTTERRRPPCHDSGFAPSEGCNKCQRMIPGITQRDQMSLMRLSETHHTFTVLGNVDGLAPTVRQALTNP